MSLSVAANISNGYNVPLGEPGRHFDGVRPVSASAGPFAARWQTADWGSRPATVRQDPEALAERFPSAREALTDEALNGTGAHNWRTHMEYQLNRAAGFDGEDFRDYTRVLAVAWSGDVSPQDFFRSEINAQRAGRRLVPLLEQLHEAGIRINLLTHSLGARVALTALNILGERRPEIVDHVFLWEPAVADNALSNRKRSDPHPLGIGVFPYAHRAAKQFVVLHSQNDGILGGDVDLNAWLVRGLSRLAPGGMSSYLDSSEQVIQDAGGAYPKKWWNVPLGGLGSPLDDYYTAFQPLARPVKDYATLKHQNWQELESALMAEMERFVHHDLDGTGTVPDYDLLEPIAIRRVLRPHHVERYTEELKRLVLGRYATGTSPRPALGYVGFGSVRHEDKFIEEQLTEGKFDWVDQTPWLFTHSGMRIPSEELFENVYEREIARRLKEDSAFGRY